MPATISAEPAISPATPRSKPPRTRGARAARWRRALLVNLLRLAVLAGLIALWEIGYRRGKIDPFFFSAPSLVWKVLEKQFRSGTIWPHIAATGKEALAGLVLGFIAGALLGWLAAVTKLIGELLEPAMLLLNSVPRVVLAPLFILWFGIGPNSKIAAAFFLVFVVIFFAVYIGMREVPPALVARVRMLGGGRWTVLREVYIPSVLTWVFSSLRITVGFAFTGAVVAELIASTEGLGYLLNFAQNSYNSSLMMATVAIIMVMIIIMFAVLQQIENYLMRWKRA